MGLRKSTNAETAWPPKGVLVDGRKPKSFAFDKSKPPETAGRKAAGLPPSHNNWKMAAGLPKRDDYEGTLP